MLTHSHRPPFRTLLFIMLLITVLIATVVEADDSIGYRGEVGSLANDYFGDGHDRWRTGSYQRSYFSDQFDMVGLGVIELRARTHLR